MAFKTVTYKILGMKQDTSESAFDNKYAYENKNIRIDARNNNTLLSIENERGNTQITNISVWREFDTESGANYASLHETLSQLPFVVIGQINIDNYIVLFGKENNTNDVIARLEYVTSGMNTGWNMIYFYRSNKLGFNLNNPIEAVANIETEKIKKVYWVDGLNVPRVINVVNKLYVNNPTIYNLTSTLTLQEQFIVTKDINKRGVFPQGKVQYCFTYFNDTDTESNIVEMSPLFDITLLNNGVAQNIIGANTNGVFNIKITNLDLSYKYVKIYCLHYSNLVGLPTITSLPKIAIPQSPGATVNIVDTYKDHIEDSITFAADSISSKQAFIPYTLGVKSNTLFFGNIKLAKPSIENVQFHFGSISQYLKAIGEENTFNAVYQYRPSLTTYKGSNYEYKGFKKHNWYRLGFIAQYYTGEWSNVIYLGDAQCTLSSETTISGTKIIPKIPNFRYTFSTEDYNTLQNLYDSGYRKIKPVCVVPSEVERTVIAQGIVSPTVYVGGNRESLDQPFAQASWFFRPTLVTSPLTISGSNITPEYAYTLRSQEDLLSLNTTNTVNEWWKHDINPNVTLNRNYREYRHGFSLPPKDRINAELDSSDASLHAYFIFKDGDAHPFADPATIIGYNQAISPLLTTADAHFLGRQITPGTVNITYEKASKVLLPDKTYQITGYKKSVFVDESIVTFNSPEIDYGNAIAYNSSADLSTSGLYLNMAGVAQITSSYSNTDISMTTVPADKPDEFKFFGGSGGRSIYNLDRSANSDLDSIYNIIKYNNATGGYKPILAGPWWYEWVYALGFVNKTGSSDPNCIEAPYEINHALAIGSPTDNDHYVLRTATGALESNFKQSWWGQLELSGGTDRATISYALAPNAANRHYLAYGEDKAPLALHTFISSLQGPAESYPDAIDCGNKAAACFAWMFYGLSAAVRQNAYAWMFTNIFSVTTPFAVLSYPGFNATDDWNRTTLYRPFLDTFTTKGYAPAGGLMPGDTDLDSTIPNIYGAHAYSNSEVNFPHNAFERYFPHTIYPFMASQQPLNGNTILYQNDNAEIPEIKKLTNLLYSKNTIYYSTLTNTGDVLNSNLNTNIFVNDYFPHEIHYDWLQDAVSQNTVITYQGSFDKALPITYKTHHLMPALRWYRGFNTLNNISPEGLAGIAKPLNLKTFTDDVLFAGTFKPLYKKSGYMQVLSLDFSPALEASTMSYSDDHDEYNAFDVTLDNPTQSAMSLNYSSTPHVVSSCTVQNNYVTILPKISITNVANLTLNYNDPNTVWNSEYYVKEYLKHILYNNVEIHLNQTPITDGFTAAMRNAIYPHTGCWARIHPACPVGVHTDGLDQTYPFWAKDFDEEYHYGISQPEVSIPIQKFVSDGNERTVDPDTVGLLHIGEYINPNNFTTAPYDDSNVQLYDWLPCGYSYQLNELLALLLAGREACIDFLEGDIYFQRYNCLKTHSKEVDNNSFNAIVEHASVYIESYINLDGRYDQDSYMDPDQLQYYGADVYIDSLNPVYSRKDNFITYKQIDYDLYNSDTNHFPTAILWSLPKIYGESVDSWSIIPMNNTYYADGICGEIVALRTVGNQLACIQQTGISVVDFDARALLQTDTLAPISIATHNSVKMQGVTYLSKQSGTYNKHTVIKTPNGLYFVDNDKQSILLLGSDMQLSNLSDVLGMSVWTRANLNTTTPWSPMSFLSDINNSFTGYYDYVKHDLYFTNNQYCVVYNESLGAFTSFYSYESIPYMFNYQDTLYAIDYNNGMPGISKLWKQHSGDYSTVFGNRTLVNYVELLVNENMIYDKIFNFLEFYYDCFKPDTTRPGNPYTSLALDSLGFPVQQIYSLDTKNEYQSGHLRANGLNLRQKQRLWRMEIPRDSVQKLDRMRSPWLFVKLILHNPLGLRQLIHSMSVNYTLPIQPQKEN